MAELPPTVAGHVRSPAAPSGARALRRSLSGSHLRTALAAGLGAAMGGAYAYVVGCRTGACPITSTIWSAALYGAAVGAIAGWPSRGR